MSNEIRWEKHIKTSIVESLVSIAQKLPSIWKHRREAANMVPNLPSCEIDLELPSNEEIYDWIEGICQWPHRRPGTSEGIAAEKHIHSLMQQLGLDNVDVDKIPITVWQATNWSLKVEGEDIPCFFTLNTKFTDSKGITAPLVYVGTGTPKAFNAVEVKGKIVVADVPFPMMPTGILMRVLKANYYLSDPDNSISLTDRQYMNFVRQNFIGGASTPEEAHAKDVYWQAYKHGALGICLILKHQPAGTNSHYGPYDGIMKPMPGLWIGKWEGDRLKSLAAKGASATLVLEGTQEPGEMSNVWGVLPGKSDETIMVTSHLDSPFQGAVEDASGIAQVLAQASAWSKLPREQRPCTMVFVASAGHFYASQGGHTFARNHPDIMKRTRVLIVLEHLAAKEVAEKGRTYEETGRIAFSVLFTTPEPRLIASVIKALKRKPAKMASVIPSTLFGPVPTSDAMGYVLESGVPVVSWIGCPYYLLDHHDTLDKIDKSELRSISESVSEMVKANMV